MGDTEQIKQLISLLQQMLPKDNTDDSDDDNSESPIKTKTTKSNKSGHKNKFLEMAEKDMHKGDRAIDKKLAINPPTPRSRKFKAVDVVCRDCGKREKVNPAILPDSAERYKCNRCSSSPGK